LATFQKSKENKKVLYYHFSKMLSCRFTTARLKVSLLLLVALVNGMSALPTMWMHNDLIGNHFDQPRLEPATKTR
jgi:hypothetical protein